MATGETSLRHGYRRPPSIIKQEQDDDSDAEEGNLGLRRSDGGESQIIHSGHFMVSSPHSDSGPRRRKSGGSLKYDFDTVNRTWCQTYRFGPFSSGSLNIDPTLTRLFDCMSLAYRYGRRALHRWWQAQPGSTQPESPSLVPAARLEKCRSPSETNRSFLLCHETDNDTFT